MQYKVVPGRLELPTSTLSVWRSNQLSYRTLFGQGGTPLPSLVHSLSIQTDEVGKKCGTEGTAGARASIPCDAIAVLSITDMAPLSSRLQKGGVPAAPSGTATLLRLSPNHRFHPRPTLAVTDFRRPRLSWLDGRCVQGPGTYSPRHG